MQNVGKRRDTWVMWLLVLIAVTAAVLFVFWGLNERNFAYSFPRRLQKVLAISITGAAIAVSSLIFQTITNNRILTPSVMGFDSLYQFLQTILVFTMGGELTMMTAYSDFFLSTGVMVGFSLVLFRFIFHSAGQNLFILVLVGMICGSFFGNLSTFMQAMVDPNEFLIIQGKMFASFSSVNTDLLAMSTVIIVGILAYLLAHFRELDVLALGRENAVNLGIAYDRRVRFYMVLVSILVSVATALVGPVTFLGVMVVNLSRELFHGYDHRLIGAGAIVFAVIALVGGQFFVERIFGFTTTVSVIVNFVGGIYFIGLLLKERKG